MRGLEITDPLLTAPAVNPRDLQSARVVCSCAHASCWDDNLSRNQVFFVSGLNHQTQPSPGSHDFIMQQVAAPRPIWETKPGRSAFRQRRGWDILVIRVPRAEG